VRLCRKTPIHCKALQSGTATPALLSPREVDAWARRSPAPTRSVVWRSRSRSMALSIDVPTPLLWVLRDVLGTTGTKFVCGLALCGACTVHLQPPAMVRPSENCPLLSGFLIDRQRLTRSSSLIRHSISH